MTIFSEEVFSSYNCNSLRHIEKIQKHPGDIVEAGSLAVSNMILHRISIYLFFLPVQKFLFSIDDLKNAFWILKYAFRSLKF